MPSPGAMIDKIYTTAHFAWTAPSGWFGETAQVGVRMGVIPSIGGATKGEIFTPNTSNAIVAKSINGSDATWNYSQNWEARFGEIGDPPLVFNTAVQADIAADWLIWWNAQKAFFASGLALTGVKIAPICPNGDFSYSASEWRLKVPSPGTSATAPMPPETSCAVSIAADIIGRRGRGRIFLPGLSVQVADTGGKVGPSYRTLFTASLKTLIDNLQNVPGVPALWLPVVAVSSNNDATMVRPSVVRCGDHFDVQRRRQHQVAEVYTDLGL